MKLGSIVVVSFEAVFSGCHVTFTLGGREGGLLRDMQKTGCEGDYHYWG